MNTQISKLQAGSWKRLHYWEDTSSSKIKHYLIIVSDDGGFQCLLLNTQKEEFMLQLKIKLSDTMLIQAGFLLESYIIIADQKGEYWKMWLGTKGAKSIICAGWPKSSNKTKEDRDTDIVNVLNGYTLLSIQYIKCSMVGIIAAKVSTLCLFDAGNLDAPLAIFPIPGDNINLCNPGEYSANIIGKYVLLYDKQKAKINVYSQNFLLAPAKKPQNINNYVDWTTKDYSILDTLFQVLDLTIYGKEHTFEQMICLGSESIEKTLEESETKADSSFAMRFISHDSIIDIGMSPITREKFLNFLINVKSPYELRQLEIFMQSCGWSMNDEYLKVSEELLKQNMLHLAFRYSVLSEKDPIKVISDYLRCDILFDSLFKWIIQLLIYDKSKDEHKTQQYILVLAYIILKAQRTDISQLIKFSEFKQLFKYEKYLNFNLYSVKITPENKLFMENDLFNKYPWLLILFRILYSSKLAKWVQDKEKVLLSEFNSILFSCDKLYMISTSPRPDKNAKDTTKDVISLEKEIMSMERKAQKIPKFYIHFIPWIRERIQMTLPLLQAKQKIEVSILKGLISQIEPNIFYQLKHRNKLGSLPPESISKLTAQLSELSSGEIKNVIKTITFDYRIFNPQKPLIKSHKAFSFFALYNGLLSSMKNSKNPTTLFENTALSLGFPSTPDNAKRLEKLKKIRSHIAISYNAIKDKHSQYYSCFLTPYVATLIVLAEREVQPLSFIDYHLMKLLSVLLTKLHSSINMPIIMQLLVQCNQWHLLGRMMLQQEDYIVAFQAQYMEKRELGNAEIAKLAISFFSVSKIPFMFFQFLFKFLEEHKDVVKAFEDALLNVLFIVILIAF